MVELAGPIGDPPSLRPIKTGWPSAAKWDGLETYSLLGSASLAVEDYTLFARVTIQCCVTAETSERRQIHTIRQSPHTDRVGAVDGGDASPINWRPRVVARAADDQCGELRNETSDAPVDVQSSEASCPRVTSGWRAIRRCSPDRSTSNGFFYVEDQFAPGWEPMLSGDNDTCIAQLKIGPCEVRQARHVEVHTPKRVGVAAAHLLDQFVVRDVRTSTLVRDRSCERRRQVRASRSSAGSPPSVRNHVRAQ